MLSLEESKSNHYSVYVVELDKKILSIVKFIRRNPNYKPGHLCLYIGATGLDVNERFKRHKMGIKANTYVQKYGIRLLSEFYKDLINLPYEEAWAKEVELAQKLRAQGYGVWQG